MEGMATEPREGRGPYSARAGRVARVTRSRPSPRGGGGRILPPMTLPRRAPAAVLLAALVLCAMPRPVPAQDPATAQWCLDPQRATLARALPGRCAGIVVDDETARLVEAERARRVREALQRAPARHGPGAFQQPEAVPGAAGDPARGRREKMAGTGFLVDGAGNAVTSLHVVAGCGLVTVAGFDRVRIAARVVAVARESDLALLATGRAAPAAVATLSPRPGRPADARAMAVGHSLLGQPSASATAVDAIVPPGAAATAHWRFAFRGKPYPGHSGSPLLDSFGEVIGVVHARAPEPGSGPEGRNDPRIGLAVSLAALRAFLAANGVHARDGDRREALAPDVLLERARRYVLRVGCWS